MNSPFPNRNRPLSATIINTTIEVARFFSVIIMFTLPDGLSLSYRAAEPVLETSRADARVIAGGEALIVQLYAEVKCVGVIHDSRSTTGSLLLSNDTSTFRQLSKRRNDDFVESPPVP